MRTQEERNDAVDRLQLNRTKCPARIIFGEDNLKAISVFISVIEKNMDENDCYNAFEDTDYLSEALSAVEYLTGQIELEELLYPEH